MKLPLLPNGKALKLLQVDGVLGGKVWPAAVALCQYLKQQQQQQQHDSAYQSTVVELGSGTGAVGIYAAAVLGYSNVMLTEHRPPKLSVITSVPYSVDGSLELDESVFQKSNRLLDLLYTNIDHNRALFAVPNLLPPRVMELDWTDPSHSQRLLQEVLAATDKKVIDLILVSDCTYVAEMHTPLANTISSLLSKPTSNTSRIKPAAHERSTPVPVAVPKCLISHQQRLPKWGWLGRRDSQLAKLESALQRACLDIVERVEHPVTEGFKTHKVTILTVQHRA